MMIIRVLISMAVYSLQTIRLISNGLGCWKNFSSYQLGIFYPPIVTRLKHNASNPCIFIKLSSGASCYRIGRLLLGPFSKLAHRDLKLFIISHTNGPFYESRICTFFRMAFSRLTFSAM